jgi:hypothetical protein
MTAAPVNVTLTGNNTFNGNGYEDWFDDLYTGLGLIVYSDGAITINNLTANDNVEGGAYLNNWDYSFINIARSITLSGTNMFMNTLYGSGLSVHSSGAIKVNNVTASNNNGYFGAQLDNCMFNSIDNGCESTFSMPVTLTGRNNFNNNLGDGLWVRSQGVITASQLTADDNHGGVGAYLDNQWAFKNSNISLSGYNTFNDNSSTGLEAYSNGNILISNLTANRNYGGTAFDGSNTGGAYLNNWSMTAVPVTVTLTGNNSFNGNGYYDSLDDLYFGSGLIVNSDGAITVSNLPADDNYQDGAWLENCLWDDGSGMCMGHGNITLTGTNTFNGTLGEGLYTDSHGNITINNVFANSNGGEGVFGGADGMLLVSCGSMTNNGLYGWHLQSNLTVTLKGVFAYNNNGGFGDTWLSNGTLKQYPTCP